MIRILLAEDDPINQEVALTKARKELFEAEQAVNKNPTELATAVAMSGSDSPRMLTCEARMLRSASTSSQNGTTVPSTTMSQPSDFILAAWALKSEAPRL